MDEFTGDIKTVPTETERMAAEDPPASLEIDPDSIRAVLEGYPIRGAILFGSRVRGQTHAQSDVDIAVAFAEELSKTERLDRRVELTAALARELGTDAVDVADLDSIRPGIGADAIKTGYRLVGTEELFQRYVTEFEAELDSGETHEERIRQFDSILERLEEKV